MCRVCMCGMACSYILASSMLQTCSVSKHKSFRMRICYTNLTCPCLQRSVTGSASCTPSTLPSLRKVSAMALKVRSVTWALAAARTRLPELFNSGLIAGAVLTSEFSRAIPTCRCVVSVAAGTDLGGCVGQGDFVSDTAPEKSPNYGGCPSSNRAQNPSLCLKPNPASTVSLAEIWPPAGHL